MTTGVSKAPAGMGTDAALGERLAMKGNMGIRDTSVSGLHNAYPGSDVGRAFSQLTPQDSLR